MIFGTGVKIMNGVRLDEPECPGCGEEALEVEVTHRYAHLYWIPMFPIGKVAVIRCAACGKLWERRKMTASMDDAASRVKNDSPAPRYFFAGTYAIAILVIAGMYVGWKSDRDTASYVRDPHINDLYVVRAELDALYPHQVVRVEEVRGDSIVVAMGTYGYVKSDDAAEAISRGDHKKSGYFSEYFTIARPSLVQLLEEKKIQDAVRPDE